MIPLPKKVKLEPGLQVGLNPPSYYPMQVPAQQIPLQHNFYGNSRRTMLESLSDVAVQSAMELQNDVKQQPIPEQQKTSNTFHQQNQRLQYAPVMQNAAMQSAEIKKEPTNQQSIQRTIATSQEMSKQLLAAALVQQNQRANSQHLNRSDIKQLFEEKQKLCVDQKYVFNAYFKDKHLVMTTVIPTSGTLLSIEYHFVAARCTICDELSTDEFISIARKMNNSQFESRNTSAIKLFLPELQVSASFHQSGKLIIKNCRNEREALVAARVYAKRIRDAMTDKSKVFLKQFRITDVKATCRLGFEVDVEKFYNATSRGSEYEEDKGYVIYRRYSEVLGEGDPDDKLPQAKKENKTGPSMIVYHTGTLKMNGFTSCLDVIKFLHIIYNDLAKSKNENLFNHENSQEGLEESSEDELSEDDSV